MIYLFNDVKELTGTVRNNHILNLLYEREKNGIYSVSAEIPVTYNDQGTIYNYNKKIQNSDFLGHYDKEGRFQLHKIAAVDIENGSIFIKGIHIFFDEAKAGTIIRDRRFVNREIIDGARVAFESIGWSVADFDVSVGKTYNFYNVTPLEARQILVETFGFEFDYWLDFDGKKVTNRHVAVKEKIGEKTSKRYTYGHNVLNIRAEQDYSEIYTAVIGRGKGEEIEETGGYGRRIEYTDVVWSTPSKPLNKPAGTRVLEDPNATQLFGYKENGVVKPRVKVEVFSDIESPTELIQASYEWLMDNNVPKAVFSLKVADGDGLNLGDEVYVIYRDIDLVKSARVEKVIDDLVSGNRDVEFGDTAYFDTDRRLSGLRSDLKRYSGETGDRIYRLKMEFNRRFDEEVSSWVTEFEQNLIDVHAEIEADRENMTNLIEGTRTEFTDNLNTEITQTKEYAEQQAQAKADSVQTNLDSFSERHQQLYDEVTGNILDIDTFLGDKSKTLKQQFDTVRTDFGTLQKDLEGVESDLTATKTDLQKQLDEARAEIEGLEVGGRNLIVNSDDLKPSTSNANVTVSKVSDGSFSNVFKSETKVAGESSYFTTIYGQVSENPKVGQQATLSLLIRGVVFEGRDNTLKIYYNSGTKNQDMIGISEEYQWLSVTFDVHSEVPRFHFYPENFSELYIARAKLEIGNIATDWTPAPEDTEQKITTLNQQIEFIDGQLSAKLEQTDLLPINNKITEYGNSLTANAQSIESLISKTELHDGDITKWSNETTANAESITSALSRISNTESGLMKAQTDIIANADGLSAVVNRVNKTETGIESLTTDFSIEAGKVETLISKTDGHDTQLTNIVADIDGIETTVAANDEWLGTYGSAAEQTIAGFEQKVWNTDIANIGANLIPQSMNSWEKGGLWLESGSPAPSTTTMRMVEMKPIKSSTQYTVSDASLFVSAIKNINIFEYSANRTFQKVTTINRGGSTSWQTHWLTTQFRISVQAIDGASVNPSFIEHLDGRIKMKMEEGAKATPMVNAISQIQQQADKLSFKVAELTRLDGEEILTQSDITVFSDRVMIGSQSISSSTMASIISVSPSAIDLISDKINVTGNVNIKGGVTALAIDAIEGNFARLFASQLTANVIKSTHIEASTTLVNKLFASSARIDQLITKTHFVNEMHALTLNVVDLNASHIRSRLLTANTIEASWIKSGTALLDRVFSSTAMFERMMAKSAFVTTLSTVTLDLHELTIWRPDGVAVIQNGMQRFGLPVTFVQQVSGGGAGDVSVQTNYWETNARSAQQVGGIYTEHAGRWLNVGVGVGLRADADHASTKMAVVIRPNNIPSGASWPAAHIEEFTVYRGSTHYYNISVPLGRPTFGAASWTLEFYRIGDNNRNPVQLRRRRIWISA